MARRPGILAANACFLLAGAGLVLMDSFSYPIIMGIYAIFGGVSQAAVLFWVDAIYYLSCMLIPCAVIGWRSSANALRFENVPPGHGLMCVLAAVICVPVVNAVTILWSILLESLGLTLQNIEILMENTGDMVLAVISMAVLPGICEELFFRGVVLHGYEQKGEKKAIIISAIMFATLHGSLQGLPAQFIMGLTLGWVVVRSGSIFTGMMLHTAYNSLLIMITYVQGKLPAEETEMVGTLFETLGAAGLFAVVVEGALSGMLLYAIMRWFRRHGAETVSVPDENHVKTGATEIIVLISGIVTVLYLYLTDFSYMLGYLK